MMIDNVASIVDPETGKRVTVRRQIEIADNPPVRPVLEELSIRGEVQQLLIDQALGLDVTDRIQTLREAYQKL